MYFIYSEHSDLKGLSALQSKSAVEKRSAKKGWVSLSLWGVDGRLKSISAIKLL